MKVLASTIVLFLTSAVVDAAQQNGLRKSANFLGEAIGGENVNAVVFQKDNANDPQERHLATVLNQCRIHAESQGTGTLSGQGCVQFKSGPISAWDDQVTSIVGSDNMCVTVYAKHNGQGSTQTVCGSTWTDVTGSVAGDVSRVCCATDPTYTPTTTEPPATTEPPPTTDPPPTTEPPPTTPPPPVSCGSSSQTGEVFDQTNAYREQNGKSTLTCNGIMAQTVQDYLQLLCDNNQSLSHSYQSTPWDRIDGTELNWSYVAENLAAGYYDASAVMSGWKGSTGHNQNLLLDRLTHIGTGYVYCSTGTRYWGQMFADLS